MKKKINYIVGMIDIDWSNNRWEKCVGCGEPKTKKGYVGLYDRNRNRFWWLKIVRECLDKYAYLCERNTPITGYWRNLQRV